MSSIKSRALELYTSHKANCAQAVAIAWQEATGEVSKSAEQFKTCGGGRSPGGLCGALYALQQITGETADGPLSKKFTEAAGGNITCREIRGARCLSCTGCVETAAGLLQSRLK